MSLGSDCCIFCDFSGDTNSTLHPLFWGGYSGKDSGRCVSENFLDIFGNINIPSDIILARDRSVGFDACLRLRDLELRFASSKHTL